MPPSSPIVIIGAGPAGLWAAEYLAQAGHRVTIIDQMGMPARKFLRAGIGGLNLTHAEPLDEFIRRFGPRSDRFAPWLKQFGPQQIRHWAAGLGIETFVGSSGRVFPRDMKAAPLLRAWIDRLNRLGIVFRFKTRCLGLDADGGVRLAHADGTENLSCRAVLLALGGASWPRLGSDGGWVDWLDLPQAPLRPSNCGFDCDFSDYFRQRFTGHPVKSTGFSFAGTSLKGECVITARGLEGQAIYALSAPLRDAILQTGQVILTLDLKPDLPLDKLAAKLSAPKGSRSLSAHLDRTIGLSGIHAGLLREGHHPLPSHPRDLAAAIKAVPVRLTAPAGLERAISTAGGIRFDALTDQLMVKARPGLFLAGEMLDWEAPTGGYLLTGCFATAQVAARGISDFLGRQAL